MPVTLMRGALHAALADEAIRRGIDVRSDTSVTGYRDSGDSVIATLSDGSEAQGTFLIGADGIHSKVRHVMHGERIRPEFTGLINLGGVVTSSDLRPTPNQMRMIWGRRAFFGYTVRASGETWWFANVGRDREPSLAELGQVTSDMWRAELVDLFRKDPPWISQVIKETDTIPAYPIHDVPTLPHWSDGHAVLIGDAVHATSPSSGQGASLAVEDAAYLAVCLRDAGDFGSA